MSRLLALAVILLVAGLVVVAVRSRGVEGGGASLVTAVRSTVTPTNPAPTNPATGNPATAPPLSASPTAGAPNPAAALLDRGLHRSLVDIDGWLNSDVASLEELRGKVVVVQFWTFGCRNCKNTLPNLRELHASTSRAQVEFVGIHAPEFDYEADTDNILAAAADLGVTWPIVLDTRRRTFHDWQEGSRAYWPRTYVLDQQGHVRFDHVGEGSYDELNAAVATLVAHPVTAQPG